MKSSSTLNCMYTEEDLNPNILLDPQYRFADVRVFKTDPETLHRAIEKLHTKSQEIFQAMEKNFQKTQKDLNAKIFSLKNEEKELCNTYNNFVKIKNIESIKLQKLIETNENHKKIIEGINIKESLIENKLQENTKEIINLENRIQKLINKELMPLGQKITLEKITQIYTILTNQKKDQNLISVINSLIGLLRNSLNIDYVIVNVILLNFN